MTADRDRDQRLLERIRAGDVAAFEALYRSIAPSLCVFTRRLLQSEAAAEDVVHDLFLAIWQQRATLDVRGSISTYLHTAARNRALNQIKHERIVAQWENAPHSGSDELQPSIEEGLVEADLSVAVQEAVARLPERPRLVFTMSRHQRMTHKQIADSLGVSIKTVETHMGSALRLMRKSLGAHLHKTANEEIERLFGRMTRLKNDHEIYRSFFVFENGPPNTHHELNGYGDDLLHRYLDAVVVNGRVGLIYSSKDYSSEWNFHADTKRFMQEDPTTFGVNLIVYALTR